MGCSIPSSRYAWWTVNSWLFYRCLLHLKATSLPLQITLLFCYWSVVSPPVWEMKGSGMQIWMYLTAFLSVPYLGNMNPEVSWVWLLGSGWDRGSSCFQLQQPHASAPHTLTRRRPSCWRGLDLVGLGLWSAPRHPDKLPLRKAAHEPAGRGEENNHYRASLQGFHSGAQFLLCDLLGCITEGLILKGWTSSFSEY